MSETLLKDIVNLEEQLQEIEQRKAEVDPSNQMRLDELTGEYNLIFNRLSEKKWQMEQEQAKAQHIEQVQGKKHEEISELILGYDFNKVFNNSEANKIIHTLLYEESLKYEERLAEKDAKIKRLNEQGMETENQLLEAKGIIEHGSAENKRLIHDNGNLRDHITKLNDEIALLKEQNEKQVLAEIENVKLRQQIVELEQQLEQAQKPKTFKPSESLAQLVENAKKAQESTLEKANRGLERWGLPPIEPPTVTVEVTPFRPGAEVDTTVVEPGADPEQEVSQFPTTEDAVVDQSPTMDSEVTREEKPIEERVRDLELAVFGRFS
jgi:DNA repair exonuclease SbcCD ATPase subunit